VSLFQMGVVEFGDTLLLASIPIVEQRRDDAARRDARIEPDAVEQLQRRRMIGAGARHLFKEIVVPERLDDAHLPRLPAPMRAIDTVRPARRR